MKEMKRMVIDDFAEVLASKAPTPGGGAVTALCSSLSSALGSMVFNLSIDKKFYIDYDMTIKNKFKEFLKRADTLREEFLALMDSDKHAFDMVINAYKLPRETEEEKDIRTRNIQRGSVFAMEVPLEVAKKTLEIFDYLEFAAEYGNPNVVSDAGVGAIISMAAIEGSVLNVKINLKFIEDAELVAATSNICDNLVQLGNEKKKNIMNLVYNKIKIKAEK
jgi:methenyltetrahydrofolate cyclohydrolase